MDEIMTEYCSVCGEELSETEVCICDACKASILLNTSIDPNI